MSRAVFAEKEAGASASRAKTTFSNLRIGMPNDSFEREADRVADAVMAERAVTRDWSLSRMSIDTPVQRKCSCGASGGSNGQCDECKEKEQKTLRRKAVGEVGPDVAPPIVHEVLNSPGQPLDKATRDFFEPRFGYDFTQVRVHLGREAAQATQAIGAAAFTVGNDIVLADDNSFTGRRGKGLLAHELSHVIQQTSARPGLRALQGRPILQRVPNGEEQATSARTHQLACVIRLGGCPSSRDAGLPSAEEIKDYNRRCSADSGYKGDVFPTTEECANPPKEPLTAGEKIFLGALLLTGAALAGAAVIVAGAEILPVVIAGVASAESAGTAAVAFYYANAIVVNEIGLFAAGLVMSCEGDVPGLLRAIAEDPAQAAMLLAEIYMLHLNVKVANGTARRASVPVQLLPADEQTDQQHIRFKSVGPPIFEEEEAAAPSAKSKSPTEGAPSQAKGIGPAYATFEEVDSLIQAGKLRKDAHVLGVIVKNPEGKIVGRWFEVSERGVGTKADPLLGHTEQKAMARISGMDLKPGSTVEFVGSLQPCNLTAGCSTRMAEFAQKTGVDVRYRYVYGESGETINDFTPGEGRITKGMRESWTH